MAIQVSKIQLRRGEWFDLPGAPSSLNPLTFTPGLDTGELGFTTDTGQLFVGQNSPTGGQANFNRVKFPYRNIEVLTENSPPDVLQAPMKDNRRGFIQAEMVPTDVFTTLKVSDALGWPQDFYVDLPGRGVCAIMTYFIFNSANNPLRLGRLSMFWNPTSANEPVVEDTAVPSSSTFQWSGLKIISPADKHLALQYKNTTGTKAKLCFCIDRPWPM